MASSVSQLRAIGFALMGFAAWVLSDVCMKLAGEAALPFYEVVGFLGFFGALVMLLKAWPEGKIKALWPRSPRAQLGRALLALACNVFNVIALKHLPLTMFYVTVFTAPMMIAILASFFLREHLTVPKVMAIIAGFIGVVIAVNPLQSSGPGDWIGYACALTGTVCFAGSITWSRVMTQTESGNSMVFFTALIEMIFGFGLMLTHAEPLTIKLLLILFGMGALCALGNFLIYMAIKHTTAANVSQFHYTQIVTGALLGYLVWHEIPTAHLLVGVGLIVAAGLYIATHARKAENLASVSPR